MFRRYIFLGLMIMLGSVLVILVLQGRKAELQRQQTAIPAEITRTAKSTAIREMVPHDLALSPSSLDLASFGSSTRNAAGRIGADRVEVRNHGRMAYHNVTLKLTLLGRGGKILEARTRLVPETVQPGQSLIIRGLDEEEFPKGAVRCVISILHADLGPGSTQ